MVTAKVEKIYPPINERPKCEAEGCDRTADIIQHSKVTGKPQYRKDAGKYHCASHHTRYVCNKRGLPSMAHVVAQNAGYDNHVDYNNSKHRFRKYRKTYCENNNGMAIWVDPDTGKRRFMHELGVVCTSTITHNLMLSVDHINGENWDDREGNHQTLCLNCHGVKSYYSKDHWSAEKKLKHLEKMLGSATSSLVFG